MSQNTYNEDTLLQAVYEELRAIASRHLRGERRGHSLSTTDLVHEAYLRLARHGVTFRGESQFRLLAARAMRRVLIDLARKRHRAKRGGGWWRVSLDTSGLLQEENITELLNLDEALTLLARQDPMAAEVVMLRFFGGFTQEETAEALGVTDRTVRNHYTYAKAALRKILDEGFGEGPTG